MKQSDVLENIHSRIVQAIPEAKDSEVKGGYRLKVKREDMSEAMNIRVLPTGTEWRRLDRSGNLQKTHTVDIVVFGMLNNESETEKCVNMLEKIVKFCLSNEPVNMVLNRDAMILSAETVPNAEAMYSQDALENLEFIGGVRVRVQSM